MDALQNEESSVLVFSNDTDVFCMLLSVLEELNCANMLIQLSKEEFVKLKTIQSALGKSRSRAVVGLHTLTGCGTVGKFGGKSKAYWTKQFLTATDDVLHAFEKFSSEQCNEQYESIRKFVIDAYGQKKTVGWLAEIRWQMFTKMQSGARKKEKQSTKANDVDMGKLPPTEGSFKQHFLRAMIQARVWYNATTALVNLLQPTEYGWMYTDEGFQPVGTKDPVVPDDLLQICGCKSGNCATKACKCRLSNISCTNLCGCNHDYCENTDPGSSIEYDDSSENESGSDKE